MSKTRVFAALVIVSVILVAAYFVLILTEAVQDFLNGLLQRPADSAAQTPDAPPEQWFAWQDVDGGRCFIDLDPDATRASERDNAQPIACVPSLPSSIRSQIFSLQTRSSNRGNDQYRRQACARLGDFPPCCEMDRPGLRTTGTFGMQTTRDAFGALCQARYGCETDAVYTSGMVPWVAENPVNCLSDANVNTCAHLLLERVDPGTLRPDPALVTPENSALLTYLCTNDSRSRASVVVPGPQMPRMTAEEMRTECLGQGFMPQMDPGAGCPAGAATSRSGSMRGDMKGSEPSEGAMGNGVPPSWVRARRTVALPTDDVVSSVE
jgi:hypothetical protein